jgi:hypothetical protein
MMESLKLLEYIEVNGHEISLESDKLRITKGKHLPSHLKNEIINQKTELIDILKRDTKAKSAGLIIGIPGTLYTMTLSQDSVAYIECVNGNWVCWRETYLTGRQEAKSHKILAQGGTFDYVLMQFKKYIDYISRKSANQHCLNEQINKIRNEECTTFLKN